MAFSLDLLLEAALFGVLLGCFYAAVSIGLSVAFGLLDVPHVAHPALVVLGSYCTFLLAGTGLDPILAGVALMPVFFLLARRVLPSERAACQEPHRPHEAVPPPGVDPLPSRSAARQYSPAD